MNKVASQVLEHSVSSCHICCLVPLGREFFSKFMQFEQNHTFEVLFRREINDNRF